MNAVIVDNGSHTLRIGYSNREPSIFRNAIFSFRNGTQRIGKHGEDHAGTETTPFDGNVVVDYECQHNVLSAAMRESGITTLEDMSCIFTVPPMTPSAALGTLTELLFETRKVQRLSFGCDFAFSHQFNNTNVSQTQYNMIVDVGYQATHLISVCKGQRGVIMRVPFGSYHANAYLRRRLLLKTSHLKSTLTRQYVETKREELCFVTKNVRERLRNIRESDWDGSSETERDATSLNSCVIVQLPFEKNSST